MLLSRATSRLSVRPAGEWSQVAALLHTHDTLHCNSRSVPPEAETLIIGGGVMGTSLAYHLAKQGSAGVVLLEKAELTSGSTWHAAGLTTTYHATVNLKPIHHYSLNLYSQLEKETGQAINLHTPGSLRVTTSDERADEMRYQLSRHGAAAAPMCLLTPAQIAEICPLLDTRMVKMGLFTKGDGHVDPYSLTQALAKGARSYGAHLLQGMTVEGLKPRSGGGWEVNTNAGTINAQRVVNAAGFYAKEVAEMAGYTLPCIAIEHQYIVTPSLPEIQALKSEIPVLRYLEASSYIRQERDGLLIGVYESQESMKVRSDWFDNGVPKEFAKELFPGDLHRLEPYLELIMELIPCFQNAQIQSIVNGPITYTPDLLPLIGPHTLPDMWLAAGLGYGIIHGGGMAKYLADWMVAGEPPAELIECDPGRFQKSWTTNNYVKAKARESYGMNNAVGYPHEERYAGRPTPRVSSAMPLQRARGAHFDVHAGWEQPAWFAGPGSQPEYRPKFARTNWHDSVGQEVNLVMTSAGIIDLCPFGKFILQGRQAGEFLTWITANAVPREGRCVVTHLLTTRGTIYGELTISRLADDAFLVVTGSGSEVHDLRWMEDHARKGSYDVSFQNITEEWGCISVAGPKSKELLTRLNPEFPQKFPFFAVKKVPLSGIDTTAIRITYTGELGWELYHPRQHTGRLYEALLAAGDSCGAGDFGTLALNVLRIEKGFRAWATEMTVDTTMMEAGMMSFLDMKKGEFLGKGAVEKQLKVLPKQLLVHVSLDSPVLDPKGDEAVWSGGKIVGKVTSGCYSYHLGKSLAFCYLPPFLTRPGTEVEVEILNRRIPATVLSGPPVLTDLARTLAMKKQSKRVAEASS